MTKINKEIEKIDGQVNDVSLDRYGEMDEIRFVLERSGTYVGNIFTYYTDYLLYVPSKHKIQNLKNIKINDAILKIFDEVITNSIDERIKSDRIFDINEIDVTIYPNGKFIVRDDGGIPVIKNKKNVWIPQHLFGTLRTSSNYNNKREGSGLNGLGAKLTNIFSSRFKVTTCDGHNKFIGIWTENMRKFQLVSVEPCTEHYTEIEFDVELFRFELPEIDEHLMRMFQKRCIDGASITSGLQINFTAKNTLNGLLDSTWKFKNFKEFVELHIDKNSFDDIEHIHYIGKDFEVVIMENIGYNYGMINGSTCNKGNHMKRIENQLTKTILHELLVKDDITLITANDIMNRITFFINCKLINPYFDSQSKDELKSKIDNDTYKIPKLILQQLNTSEIYKQIKEYYTIKFEADKVKTRRKINENLRKTKPSLKLINCRNKKNNELYIFEGNSAQGGFGAVRDTNYQMAYMLTGKVKNAFDLNDTQLFENREFRELCATLDLRLNTPQMNLNNCTADKIIFSTDADFDGYHITGLLIVFFAIWFPELFRAGKIYRLLAPIGIATKGSGKTLEEHFFYSYSDYDLGKEQLAKKGFTFMYKKGLGSLNDRHYEKLINDKKLERIILSPNYEKTLRDWFASSTERRKEIIRDGDLFDKQNNQ